MRRTPAVLATTTFAMAAAGVAMGAMPTATASPSAEQIFRADCAVCHGASGHGTDRGPSLRGVGKASFDYELRTGRMPLAAAGRTTDPNRPVTPLPEQNSISEPIPKRHHPAYDERTIRQLVDYGASLAGGDGPDIPVVASGELAAGGELFRLQCAACHAWAGDGGALFHREAPSLHAATPTEIAEAIRVGPGQMPVFGPAALSDKEVDDVAAYVRYLDAPRDRGGNPLAHLGPVSEGAVALAALGVLVLVTRWIGDRE